MALVVVGMVPQPEPGKLDSAGALGHWLAAPAPQALPPAVAVLAASAPPGRTLRLAVVARVLHPPLCTRQSLPLHVLPLHATNTIRAAGGIECDRRCKQKHGDHDGRRCVARRGRAAMVGSVLGKRLWVAPDPLRAAHHYPS